MEYREGRCPKCNEVMQIPADREKIICMFCGQEFSASESRKAEAKSHEAEMKKLEACIGPFFQDVERTVKGFQRNAYKDSFADYLEQHRERLLLMKTAMETAPDREQARERIAKMMVEAAGETLAGQRGKIGRESSQMTMNMYMVTFVLPAVLSVENGKLSGLADEISRQWAAAFKKSNIQAASYDTLQSGFKRKLCYVTTAVCESLHKPEDCYELKLLKKYRDGYLSASEGGGELIAQYYDMAPTIVKRVGRRQDCEEIYKTLYETYISPCVHLIEEAKNEECLKKYQEMVEMLRAEYM